MHPDDVVSVWVLDEDGDWCWSADVTFQYAVVTLGLSTEPGPEHERDGWMWTKISDLPGC